MKREWLSSEERREYDALLTEAGFDEHGQRRPSAEIGPRMDWLLHDAVQAGRQWAVWVRQDDAEAGHLGRFKRWDKARHEQKVFYGGDIVPRAAVVGIRRRDAQGEEAWQQALWRELTWEEVHQKVDEARAQIRSGRITVATANKLLRLRERVPDSTGPLAACEVLGIDFDEYLAGDEEGAAEAGGGA